MSDKDHIQAALEASFAVAEALSKIENPALQRRARAAMSSQNIVDERLVALLDSLGEPLSVGDNVTARCAQARDKSGFVAGPDCAWGTFRVRSTKLFGKYIQLETLDGDVCSLPFSGDDLLKVGE